MKSNSRSRSFSSLFVASIDEKMEEAAALIRARHTIRLPDALQVAAAIQGEATLFLTNDKRIKKVDAVEVLVLSDFLKTENSRLLALPFTESPCPLAPARSAESSGRSAWLP